MSRPPLLRAFHALPGELVISAGDEARFWARVDRDGPVVRDDLGPCWTWKGGRNKRRGGELSYGKFTIGKRWLLAHRVAWVISNGHLETGAVVAHLCDNVACVRPSHLRAGTQAENLADMRAKGRAHFHRFQAGVAHPNAKLTPGLAAEVRRMRESGLSLAKVGAAFGLNASTVHDIVTGKTWRDA